jgi:GT2 family glycosyltransferase
MGRGISVATLGVVIPTKNRASDLKRCLDSLDLKGNAIPREVIVIDNGSTDRTSEVLSQFPMVRRVWDPTPNLPHLFNEGWRQSSCDIIGFLNDDAAADPGWGEEVVRWFAQLPEASVIGGPTRDRVDRRFRARINRGQTGLFQLYNEFLLDGQLFDYGVLKPWGAFSIGTDCPDRPTDVDSVTITNMAVKRAALEQLVGFDEDFAFSYYDGDFFLRAKRAGMRIVAVPTAGADHFPNPTGNTRSTQALARDFAIWCRKLHPGSIKGSLRVRLGQLSLLGFWLAETLAFRKNYLSPALRGLYQGRFYKFQATFGTPSASHEVSR